MVRSEVSEAVEAARPSPSHEPFTVKFLAVDERFGVASSLCDELIRFCLGQMARFDGLVEPLFHETDEGVRRKARALRGTWVPHARLRRIGRASAGRTTRVSALRGV